MAKILMFVVDDIAAPGIRAIGAWLKHFSHHEPVLVLIGDGAQTFYSNQNDIPDEPWQNENVFAGFFSFNLIAAKDTPQELPQAFLDLCREQRPDIIGLSTRFVEPRFQTFFAQIRKVMPESVLVAGGHGPSTHAEAFLDWGCDAVCRGEGEKMIVQLCDSVEKKSGFADVPNLVWREHGEIRRTPLLPVIADLDELPLPMRQDDAIWHILDGRLYHGDFPYTSNTLTSLILAGRGCIGTCAYCAAPLWRNVYQNEGLTVPKHRHRSNDLLIQEALEMKKGGARSIFFCDDFFIRPYEEMADFFLRWKKEVGLPFYLHPHIGQFAKHPDLFSLAVDAGLSWMLLAVQSSDEQFCKDVFKRNNDNESILKFAHMAWEAYLPVVIQFIDGYRFGEHDDFENKLDFMCKMPPFDPAYILANTFSCYKLIIHEGSELARAYPDKDSCYLSRKEFMYRAMLMHFRLILDDEAFAKIRADENYRQNPAAMFPVFQRMLNAKQLKYLRDSAKRLAGREVWFYGATGLYAFWKNTFSRCRPRGILLDWGAPESGEIDGLPVYKPEDVLKTGERLPVILFSANALVMARKIKLMRPDYQRDELIGVER